MLREAIIVQLAMLMIFLGSIPCAISIEYTFCVGTGYSNLNETGLGLISMGASSIYNHPVSTIWGANIVATKVMPRSDRPSIRIHSVSGTSPNGDKKQLRGWLYLEIEKPGNHYFNALAVWALLGEEKRTSGEFVYLPKNSCGLWSDLKNYLPCSAVALNMPITSNMFIYTDDGSRKQRVFKLLWRLSSSYCNRPGYVFFFFAFNSERWNNRVAPFHIKNGATDVNGKSTDVGALLVQTKVFKLKFYGMSAPIYDPSSLSCTSPNSEVQITVPDWAAERIDDPADPKHWGVLQEIYDVWRQERWNNQTGVENEGYAKWASTCKAQSSGLHVFGGRCVKRSDFKAFIYASDDISPECKQPQNDDAWLPDELIQLESNGHFKLKLEERKTIVETGCDPDCLNTQVPTETEVLKVPTPSELSRSSSLEDILNAHTNQFATTSDDCADRRNSTDRNLFGLCSLTAAGQAIYGVRQWHGLAMLTCSMIIVPIQCFTARYLKGAIPVAPQTKLAHLPLRTWYIIHIILLIPLVCLFGSAMAAVKRQVLALGRSKTLFARAHQFFGYVYFGVFVFQTVSGCLRPLNIRYRKMAIFTHWLVGIIFNYGGAILSMLTYGIPSSPTAHVSHLRLEEFYKMYNHVVPMILLVWLILEGVIHTLMTMNAVRFDREHNVERTPFPILYPPAVPYQSLVFEDDYRAKAVALKRASFGYVTWCIVIFIASCITMYTVDDVSEFGLGPMSCTHDENNKYITEPEPNSTREVELRQFYIENNCQQFLKT